MNITKDCVATLEYTITDTQKNLLDSGAEPLIYLHGGYGDIFSKLEEALEGKKVGDSISVTLSAKESFGEYDEALVSTEARGEFDEHIFVGEQFIESDEEDDEDDGLSFTITKITDEEVTLDGNHPLAGIDVVFEATVLAVRKANAKEIKAQHAHS